MKAPVDYTIKDGRIYIGFLPKVDVKDGLVIEHGEAQSMVGDIIHQPTMMTDLKAGISDYELPSRTELKKEEIKEVYLELPE